MSVSTFKIQISEYDPWFRSLDSPHPLCLDVRKKSFWSHTNIFNLFTFETVLLEAFFPRSIFYILFLGQCIQLMWIWLGIFANRFLCLMQKSFSFAVRDSLTNVGPLKDFSYGLRFNADANATGISKQSNYELVSCTQFISKFMYHVHIQPSKCQALNVW